MLDFFKVDFQNITHQEIADVDPKLENNKNL